MFPPNRPALVAPLIAVVVSGCLTAPSALPGTMPEALHQQPIPSEEWLLEAHASPSMLASLGIGFLSDTSTAQCAVLKFEAPEHSSMLELQLSGPAVNAARPGAGYMSFLAKHPDDPWLEPDESGIRDAVNLTVHAPSNGTWVVWVWPNGPVVNQEWDLYVQLSGVGSSPAPLAPKLLCDPLLQSRTGEE